MVMEQEEEDKLLLNRLTDTEQYMKELQDEMKQLEFETAPQPQIQPQPQTRTYT